MSCGAWPLEPADAVAPGVVVLVAVLIGGTCMQLRHCTFLLSHPCGCVC